MNIIVKTFSGHCLVRPDTSWERKSDDFYLPERKRLLTQYFPYRSSIVLKNILSYVGPTSVAEVKAPVADDRYYNLQGQLVDRPTKGIYIRNGRKVVVR